MRNLTLIGTTLLFGALLSACGSGGGGTGGTTSTTTGEGGTGTTSTTTGTGGTTTSSTTGTGGTGTTTSSTTGTGGTGTTTTTGSGGAGPAVDHLLISEISTSPNNAEFIEIENPTSAAVDLSNYYISDNATYHGIAAGQAFNPPLATPGTDFLAQFPAGASIPAGGIIVIATNGGFDTQFSKCPDYILSATPFTCTSGTAKAMVIPANGSIGGQAGLSNAREMVILFRWAPGSAKVEDVDYVTWGAMSDAETRADKSAVTGYLADTPAASQSAAAVPAAGESIERCGSPVEQGEKASGGNGITGHDATSESLDVTFKIQTMPTPGAKNSCL